MSGSCGAFEAGDQGCGQLCVFTAHFGSCRENSALGLEIGEEAAGACGPRRAPCLASPKASCAAFLVPSPRVCPFLDPQECCFLCPEPAPSGPALSALPPWGQRSPPRAWSPSFPLCLVAAQEHTWDRYLLILGNCLLTDC